MGIDGGGVEMCGEVVGGVFVFEVVDDLGGDCEFV